MKKIFIGFLFLLAACTAPPQTQSGSPELDSSLPDLGTAPELTNNVWLNAEKPLRLADLRGKVVAIDMWTFG